MVFCQTRFKPTNRPYLDKTIFFSPVDRVEATEIYDGSPFPFIHLNQRFWMISLQSDYLQSCWNLSCFFFTNAVCLSLYSIRSQIFDFRVFFFLDRLTSKTRYLDLPCYLANCFGEMDSYGSISDPLWIIPLVNPTSAHEIQACAKLGS